MQIIGKLTTKLERETGTSKSGKSWEKQLIVIEQAGTEYNKENNKIIAKKLKQYKEAYKINKRALILNLK